MHGNAAGLSSLHLDIIFRESLKEKQKIDSVLFESGTNRNFQGHRKVIILGGEGRGKLRKPAIPNKRTCGSAYRLTQSARVCVMGGVEEEGKR